MIRFISCSLFLLGLSIYAFAADVAGSTDPAGMKRYEGSEIIGYRAPKFDEFLLPLGPPTEQSPPKFAKSLKTEGLISLYTYLAPTGRTGTELLRNYKLQFQRLGRVTLYDKGTRDRGWFGPIVTQVARDSEIGDILAYNESQQRVLVGKSKDAAPTHYYVFVTTYRDGRKPDRLEACVAKDRAIAQLVVIAPEKMEEKMAFANGGEVSKSLLDSGKDSLRPDSQPTLEEITKLLATNPKLRVQVAGRTDNQGTPDYTLDLSRRRAAVVVRELTSKYAVASGRLGSFGCGLYSPVASNDSEEGKARNRRVELVQW